MQNNSSGLINFEVKIYSNIFGIVNMMSRGVLEHYVGCCNHGAM